LAVDRLHATYFVLVVAALAAAFARTPGAGMLIALNLAVGAFWWFVPSRLRWRDPLGGRVLLSLLTVPFAYLELAHIVPYLNPHRYGPALRQIDLWLFGRDPLAALFPLQEPVLTEILQIVYSTFYLLPVVLAYALYRKRDRAGLAHALVALVLGFYVSYVGYALVPAYSPLYLFSYPEPLEGVVLFDFLRGGLHWLAPWRLDCFPSGHTEITALIMVLSYRRVPRLFAAFFLPWGSLLIFSTVYLRYHYVVDLLAGLALVPIVLLGTRRLLRLPLNVKAV